MFLLDGRTPSSNKTRLQSKKSSCSHVLVGWWRPIFKWDTAAIEQQALFSCSCWLVAPHLQIGRGCNRTTGVVLMFLLDWRPIFQQDAAATEQQELFSCSCWIVAPHLQTGRGCNRTTGVGVVMFLLDGGTPSSNRTRLQSNNRSCSHVLVGWWHPIFK